MNTFIFMCLLLKEWEGESILINGKLSGNFIEIAFKKEL